MMQATAQQILAQALRCHQSGQLAEAQRLYQQVLSQEPSNADALHLLGRLALQAGRADVAVDLNNRALAVRGNFPEALFFLGVALQSTGQLDLAIGAFERAIACAPDLAEAYGNLGVTLMEKGRADQAIARYRQAISLRPDFADAHNNLCVALTANGQWEEAIAAGQRAVAINPQSADAHFNLGNAFTQTGRLDQGIAAYRAAIGLRNNYGAVYCNLGNALKARGQLDEAMSAYRQAIAIAPTDPQAHNNLGVILADVGQLDEAVEECRRAISLSPGFSEAHSNLARVLVQKWCPEEAIAACRQAIAIKPGYPGSYVNLCDALVEAGRPEEAIEAARQAILFRDDIPEAHCALGHACKAAGRLDEAIAAISRAIALRPQFVQAHDNLVYTMLFHAGNDSLALADEHRRWNRMHAEALRENIEFTNDPSPQRRLKIGYVSPDFREHPVGRFMLPLLANHDKTTHEIVVYSDVRKGDAITDQCAGYADLWRNVASYSDQRLADQIRQDHIDVLVDLTMHMAHNRLLVFARKPAPVQVTYLAYVGTTGLTAMDYRLSDPYLDPPGGDESLYSEKTLRVGETFWCYQPVKEVRLTPPPRLDAGVVTFGCLNNFCKVNQELVGLWGAILRRVPASRLVLHAPQGGHCQRVLEWLKRDGIDASRVSFVSMLPRDLYFAQYAAMDIALDTHPYGGGTTTCDALWLGVPVVSLVGKTVVGRSGVSILSNLGLRELLAESPADYVKIAIGLANDATRLNELRATLRRRMETSPLMDAPRFARSMESAYRTMWVEWCGRQRRVD